jgi:hypothetical protein
MAGHRDGKAVQHEKRCEEEGEFFIQSNLLVSLHTSIVGKNLFFHGFHNLFSQGLGAW